MWICVLARRTWFQWKKLIIHNFIKDTLWIHHSLSCSHSCASLFLLHFLSYQAKYCFLLYCLFFSVQLTSNELARSSSIFYKFERTENTIVCVKIGSIPCTHTLCVPVFIRVNEKLIYRFQSKFSHPLNHIIKFQKVKPLNSFTSWVDV